MTNQAYTKRERAIAKRYLDWFEQEAPRDAELFFRQNSDYAVQYRDSRGIKNAIDFVRDLANARLSPVSMPGVIYAAQALLNGESMIWGE